MAKKGAVISAILSTGGIVAECTLVRLVAKDVFDAGVKAVGGKGMFAAGMGALVALNTLFWASIGKWLDDIKNKKKVEKEQAQQA